MSNLQKMGGFAGIIEGLTYIIGFGMALGLFADYFAGEMSAVENAKFVVDNEGALFLWNVIIYVINGIFLVVLAAALHQRLKDNAPDLMPITTAFGMIWAGLVIASGMLTIVNAGTVIDLYESDPAQAGLAWQTLTSIENGLGGGVEVVGGVWVLLLSVAAWRGGLPKALNMLGVLIGVAGIVTVVPALADFGAIFGLGFILWFIWAGIVLLRAESPAPQTVSTTARATA